MSEMAAGATRPEMPDVVSSACATLDMASTEASTSGRSFLFNRVFIMDPPIVMSSSNKFEILPDRRQRLEKAAAAGKFQREIPPGNDLLRPCLARDAQVLTPP